MKYINELPKEEQKKLSEALKIQIVTNTELVCMIADNYKVNRNETLDLYMYLQKKYCEKQDLNNRDLKSVKLAGKIAKKLLKRGAE